MATPSGPNPSLPNDSGIITTKFDVGMTCEGCASAVKRVLGKVEGVSEVVTDVDTKVVLVTSTEAATKEIMLEKLNKWGEASGKSVALSAAQ